MRCIQARRYQAAADQRREAGRRGLFHGRQGEACGYREGGAGAWSKERQQYHHSGYGRPAPYR